MTAPMPLQPDLFGEDAADTARCLHVLAACDAQALAIMLDLPRARSAAGGDFPWSIAHGWLYRNGHGVYMCRPNNGRGEPHQSSMPWQELDRATAGDPRLPAVAAWAAGIDPHETPPGSTLGCGWRHLRRPEDLYPPGSRFRWYVAAERADPGWPARLAAWQATIAILADAADRARP